MGKAQAKDNTDDKDSFVDELKPGTKLMHGQYTIENFLNAGGFGITYLARDSLDRKIVIKECFPGAFCRRSRYVVQARSRAHQNELKSIVRLFVQEARSLAKLDHPNIVGVHQVFEDNETAYMALDFIEGRDLLDTIDDPNHGLTPAQIKVILKEVLGAVGFIHEQGILHRDISPDNILINSQFHPVLIDFGAAREEATKQSRVLSALRVVKDGYSPQEFYIAGSDQSPSSDLYALAASFHHLIAKEVPPNSQARLAAIASGDPDPYVRLAGRHPQYDDAFLAAIDKALEVLPKDRLQSAKEWIDMMEGAQGNVTPLNVATARDTARSQQPDTAPQKSKMPLLLGSAAVLAIIVGAGVMFMSTSENAPATTTFAEPVQQAPVQIATAPAAPVVVERPATTPRPAADTPVAVVAPAPVAPPAPLETPATLAPAQSPAIAEEVTPAIVPEQVTPVIVEETATVATDTAPATAPAVVGGPVIVGDDSPTPEIRPATRPENLEFAALPEVVEPPLPEPVVTPRPASAEPVTTGAFPDQTANRPTTDSSTADLIFPATPGSIDAVGTGPAVTIDAITPGNELPQPEVTSTWSVQLPFSGAAPDSNVVGEIGAITPVWVRPGIEITSVNGTPINSIAEIPGTLRAAQPSSPGDTVQVTFGISDPTTGESAERPWIMPVVQQTELGNGIRFQSAFAGSNWRTSVVNVPEGVTTDLRAGDVVTLFIPTSENIGERDTLATIIERELNSGTEQFMFAVQREGSMWVASMTIDEQN
ncbi:serine/threonine protein kinase [Yoonia sp.]|uniref:serine/threonine protein kinase n=1 Tax=Yoonia sp. TaxID=2212373 RepID=UPI003F6D959B